MRKQTLRHATIRIGALLAVLACGTAMAGGEGGEGNSGTDRGKRVQHLPLICRTNETAVAVRQADGSITWKCSAVEAVAPAEASKSHG
ncbi:hypothetical protein [Lysobacter enzymogenes]|uniref:Secreted protein n=1 Tax=Lysobacter enzymogenes TaxID=69 RepID=A0AAU9ARB8_LYSEN|nr:hypothetical protein [Lysobacter enzymogenes]BAV97167.1 conserved hypothetical protein [Lysobacter enzymogenes]